MSGARNKIVLLDDEPDRVCAMKPLLEAGFPGLRTQVFDNAPDALTWLALRHSQMRLACLDHDLGPDRWRKGVRFDPGTGRDVADWLALLSPCCPIVIHTTNHLAAPGMVSVLEEAGWNVSQVSPYGDLDWVGETWIDAVRAALRVENLE